MNTFIMITGPMLVWQINKFQLLTNLHIKGWNIQYQQKYKKKLFPTSFKWRWQLWHHFNAASDGRHNFFKKLWWWMMNVIEKMVMPSWYFWRHCYWCLPLLPYTTVNFTVRERANLYSIINSLTVVYCEWLFW